MPWSREQLPTPVLWPGEFHGLYSPWGHKESDMTESFTPSFVVKLLNFPGPNPPYFPLSFQKPNAHTPASPISAGCSGCSLCPEFPTRRPITAWPMGLPELNGILHQNWKDLCSKVLQLMPGLSLCQQEERCHAHHCHSPASPSLQERCRCPSPSPVFPKPPRLTAITALTLLCSK